MALSFERKITPVTIISSDGKKLHWIMEDLVEKCEFFRLMNEEVKNIDEISLPFTAEEITLFLNFLVVDSHIYLNVINELYGDKLNTIKKYIEDNFNDYYFHDFRSGIMNEKHGAEIVIYMRTAHKICLDIIKICDFVMIKDSERIISTFLRMMSEKYYIGFIVRYNGKKDLFHQEIENYDLNTLCEIFDKYCKMMDSEEYCVEMFIRSIIYDRFDFEEY